MNKSSLSSLYGGGGGGGCHTPISWDTDWDCSSTSSYGMEQHQQKNHWNSIEMIWFHRNFSKQTTYESFVMKYSQKFRLECTEITANLRDKRRLFLESLTNQSLDIDESMELLCGYVNLFYGFIWCLDESMEEIPYHSTSKLSTEFQFNWSDSIHIPNDDHQQHYRSEKDSMFELISIIYHYALNLLIQTTTMKQNNDNNNKQFMDQFDNLDQKRLRLASLLFRIIGDQFLSLSSPLTILTEHQTDLDSNILRTYQYQCIAEEREIELFKWIRSQINGPVWKWPKIVEISGEAETAFHTAYSYLRMEYRTTPELIPLWRCYLQAKRNLYRTIRLIHLDIINKNNLNNQHIHYWFDETKRLFESYNQLTSVTRGYQYRHLDRMEIFDWIEQILPVKQSNDSWHNNNNRNYDDDNEYEPIIIRLDVLQPKIKVDKIVAKLFRRDELWTRKVYDAFGTMDNENSGHNRRLNIIEQMLNWRKPNNSLRIRSQPLPLVISKNKFDNFIIKKSLKSKSAEESTKATNNKSKNNGQNSNECSSNFVINDRHDYSKPSQRFIRTYRPIISWPLENESYIASSNNSSGYESTSSNFDLSGRSSSSSSFYNDENLRTLIDTRKQSLLLRKTRNSQLIDLSIVMNNNNNMMNSNSNDFHRNNDCPLLTNRLFPISIDSEIVVADDDELQKNYSINSSSTMIRMKPSIQPKPKQKSRII